MFTCTDRAVHALLMLVCVVLAAALAPVQAAGTIGQFERAMMPGPVIEGHAEYENQCEKCHSRFDKDAQNGLCLDCHKEVRADVNERGGYHGRLRDIKTRPCKVCHTEHKGRDFDVVPLDRNTFDHDQTDFELKGSHELVRCEQCHEPKKKYREAPSTCVKCHEDEEPHEGKLGEKCDICHDETKWQTFFFDHSRTDFELKGKHIGVACGGCHVNERYKGIPTKCYACHKLDDRHKGQYSESCDKCHVERGWHQIVFDHDKDTEYKLEDGHRRVACGQCHKGENIYQEDLKTDCYACHRFKDEHKGAYGKKCADCHSPKGWTEIGFDHDDDTDYPLRGKHEKVACVDCHPGDLYEDETPTDCYSCHRQDDVHDGQEGKKCDQCHSEEGWIRQVDFDHDLTKFPLLGAHATVACEECHFTSSFQDAEVKCASCHGADDVHEKRLTPHCERCHNGTDWKLWVFDHDRETDFKLDGAHKDLHCDLCHEEPVEDKIEMGEGCYGCHAVDDAHNGTYGRYCERCHVTSSFRDFKPGWRR